MLSSNEDETLLGNCVRKDWLRRVLSGTPGLAFLLNVVTRWFADGGGTQLNCFRGEVSPIYNPPFPTSESFEKKMDNSEKIILHLCASEFGSDTRDYRAAGYDVRAITKDIGVENYHPPENVYGIIANPPCTMFSKARTKAKLPRDMNEGLRLVKECLRIIWECQTQIARDVNPEMPLKFWALENPDGYLKWFLGKPAFQYSPEQFGDTAYKKTNLWGIFNEPKRPFFSNVARERVGGKDYGWGKSDLRSIASPYFTKAFFIANP